MALIFFQCCFGLFCTPCSCHFPSSLQRCGSLLLLPLSVPLPPCLPPLPLPGCCHPTGSSVPWQVQFSNVFVMPAFQPLIAFTLSLQKFSALILSPLRLSQLCPLITACCFCCSLPQDKEQTLDSPFCSCFCSSSLLQNPLGLLPASKVKRRENVLK